ncbi:alpha-L-arabinofuranosidase B-like protein [Streptomyces sp. 846.5]|nr:AbfB domain-containing protein [Streptomyces sp. 846.5]TDU04411.1 alpha-L-arabinofuranosidase B-like protein [Streptomyces sp. 846.5]
MTADEPNTDSQVPNPRPSMRIPPYLGPVVDGSSDPAAIPGAVPGAMPAGTAPAKPGAGGGDSSASETTAVLPVVAVPEAAPQAAPPGPDGPGAAATGAELVLRPVHRPERRAVVPSALPRLRDPRRVMTLVLSTAAVFSLATAVFVIYEATRGDTGTRPAAGALPTPAPTDAMTPSATASESTPSAAPSSAAAQPVAVTSRSASTGNPTALNRSGGGASYAPTTPASTRTATPTPTPTAATGGTGLTAGTTYSIESVDAPGQYWYVTHYLVYLGSAHAQRGPGPGPGTWNQTAFRLVSGLADPSCFSFQAADGDYLRHQNFRLKQAPDDGSPLFQHDATFCPRAGSATGSFAFESVNYPGYYLHHRGDELWLDQDDGSSSFRSDASFWATSPVL